MTTKTVLQVLKEARELISDPARWGQGFNYMDAEGKMVNHEQACRFCSYGAIGVASNVETDNNVNLCNEASNELNITLRLQGMHGKGFSVFNDENDHATVMGMWDRTIARLEAACARTI